MFFNDPAPMLDELGDGSILLMPMNRAPARREEKNQKFGLYNAGTITFRPGETTTEALRSWRERCLAWSPGESGLLDQPLIQDWPERFDGVRAVTHRGCGIAPWNVVQYRVELRDGVPYVDDVPAIFYHHIMLSVFHSVSAFHRTRFLVPPRHLTRTPLPLYWERHAPYGVAPGETEAFWEPYVQEFGRALLDVRGLDPTFKAGLVDAGPPGAAEAEVEPTIESGYQPIRAWGRRLQPSWRYPTGDERVRLRVTEAGDLEVQCSLSGEESVYLREGETPFEDPPAEGADWEARPSAFHELSAEATFVSGAAEVRLIAIEYDERRRLRDHRLLMMEGLNALQFTTSEQMSQLRLVLRFSGSGTVVLSPLRLSEPLASPSGHETRRPHPSDSESTSGSTSSGDGEGSQWSEEYVNQSGSGGAGGGRAAGSGADPGSKHARTGDTAGRAAAPAAQDLANGRSARALAEDLHLAARFRLHRGDGAAADTPAGPLQVRDDVSAGFWRWQDHDPEGRLQPRETGELLKQLHELLSGCPVELPVMDPISVKPHLSRLGEEAELDAAAIEFLATRFEELERGWREFQTELGTGPIHGHLNTSNILVTPEGPFFIDFDRVAMGPREWDLARLAPPASWGGPQRNGVPSARGTDTTFSPGMRGTCSRSWCMSGS